MSAVESADTPSGGVAAPTRSHACPNACRTAPQSRLSGRADTVQATDTQNHPRLEFEFEFHGHFATPYKMGTDPGPFGVREFYETLGGEVTGERISGDLLRGGGDWLLISNDGWGHLDVRSQIKTHDGAFILLSYHGSIELNDAVRTAIDTGADTAFSDQYFHIAPRLETGDSRYSWVNNTVFAAKGRIIAGGGVQYLVSRVS